MVKSKNAKVSMQFLNEIQWEIDAIEGYERREKERCFRKFVTIS